MTFLSSTGGCPDPRQPVVATRPLTGRRGNRLRPAVDGTDPTDLIVMLEGNRPIGLIQSYRIGDNPEWLAVLQAVDPNESIPTTDRRGDSGSHPAPTGQRRKL
jgi:hypothetical protein